MKKLDSKTSFQNGVYHIKEQITIDHLFYTKYVYYLPGFVIDALYEIEYYFEKVDNFDKNLKKIDRIRHHPHEFVDTASIIFAKIRKHLLIGSLPREPIILGSGFLCPVAWAILGESKETTFSKHYFKRLSEFLDYYMLQIQEEESFSRLSIYQRPANNHFIEVSRKSKFSVNLIVSIAILFLKDLIENCGPDCGYFLDIFTNNKKHNFITAIPSWRQIGGIIEKSFSIFPICRKTNFYNAVEVEEKISFPLHASEKLFSLDGEELIK